MLNYFRAAFGELRLLTDSLRAINSQKLTEAPQLLVCGENVQRSTPAKRLSSSRDIQGPYPKRQAALVEREQNASSQNNGFQCAPCRNYSPEPGTDNASSDSPDSHKARPREGWHFEDVPVRRSVLWDNSEVQDEDPRIRLEPDAISAGPQVCTLSLGENNAQDSCGSAGSLLGEGIEGLGDVTSNHCEVCRMTRPLADFYKVVTNVPLGTTRYCNHCKECITSAACRWYNQHRESMKKECENCRICKPLSQYNMTVNYAIYKYALRNEDGWERALAHVCRHCAYQQRRDTGDHRPACKKELTVEGQQTTVCQKRCRKCGEVKIADVFPKDKYMVDGLYIYCKPCTSAMKRKQKADRQANQAKAICNEGVPVQGVSGFVAEGGAWRYVVQSPLHTPSDKRCRKCNVVKAAIAFRKSPSNLDGRVNVCKGCQIAVERERRVVQKEKQDLIRRQHNSPGDHRDSTPVNHQVSE